MLSKKVIFGVFLAALFEAYRSDDGQFKNRISPDECHLKELEYPDPKKPYEYKIKGQYFNEFGLGVLNYLKLDWAPIGTVNEDYVKKICECFFTSYYVASKGFSAPNKLQIQVETNYFYCREHPYTKWYQKCLRSPVVRCSVAGQVFFLAESVKFYLTRRVRNVFLFEVPQFDWSKITQTGRNNEFLINYPIGDFKLVAQAVDLKKCY